MIEIESKVLFPVGRVLLLVMVVLSVGGIFLSLSYITSHAPNAIFQIPMKQDMGVHVEPRILKSLPAGHGRPSSSGSPIVTMSDPAVLLDNLYPELRPSEILKTGKLQSLNEKAVQQVKNALYEAEAAGDDLQAYKRNAIRVLDAEGDEFLWEESFRTFHNRRMEMVRLHEMREKLELAQREAEKALAREAIRDGVGAIFGFLLIIVMLVILAAVLAIERNTRKSLFSNVHPS